MEQVGKEKTWLEELGVELLAERVPHVLERLVHAANQPHQELVVLLDLLEARLLRHLDFVLNYSSFCHFGLRVVKIKQKKLKLKRN